MKALLLTLLLWQAADSVQSPDANQHNLRYERAVVVPAAASNSEDRGDAHACATLDALVYTHAAPSLKDLRLFQDAREVPYAITLSEAAEFDSEPAKVVNLGVHGRQITFDLVMPARPYTDVQLDLDAHDFVASADVSGTNRAGEPPTRLGSFTLFDLTAQQLSRNTILHLQESNFRSLHVTLSMSPAQGAEPLLETPSIVKGATVPPSREAQTIYTDVAETTASTQRGRQTIASFRLPAHLPVERISFVFAPAFTGNFSRSVKVTDRPLEAANSAKETLTGTILRVWTNQSGREIRQEQMTVPATLGANLQTDAAVEVLIENGNDKPLPVASVHLEMRQRRLCFAAPPKPELTLFYGDAALDAPSYDYARLYPQSGRVLTAKLAAEQQNPDYIPRPKPLRSLSERHPELLWIVLLAVICVLAVVALHSAKKMPR